MNQVRCPGREVCPDKGCTHAEPHTIGRGCTEPCEGYRGQAQGSTCEPVPTDLFGPLTPPWGVEEPAPAKSYVCNEAGECGIAECTAAEAHTHNEPPLHGPRQCGFTLRVVSCKEVPELVKCDTRKECGATAACPHYLPHAETAVGDARIGKTPTCYSPGFYCVKAGHRIFCNPVPSTEPLQGVWVSGKALEVLSQYRDWSNDKWDAFWAMVTGKAAHHTDAERVMQEANGPGVTETMTEAVWEESVRAILADECFGKVDWEARELIVGRATAAIVKLPRPETP